MKMDKNGQYQMSLLKLWNEYFKLAKCFNSSAFESFMSYPNIRRLLKVNV